MSAVATPRKRGRTPDRPKPAPSAADNPWPQRLVRLRDRLGNITQAQAAARIDISQSQWSAFEAGKRQPTRPIAKLIGLLESGKI
jgi:DNA-binding transcriptional regulator YiaG